MWLKYNRTLRRKIACVTCRYVIANYFASSLAEVYAPHRSSRSLTPFEWIQSISNISHFSFLLNTLGINSFFQFVNIDVCRGCRYSTKYVKVRHLSLKIGYEFTSRKKIPTFYSTKCQGFVWSGANQKPLGSDVDYFNVFPVSSINSFVSIGVVPTSTLNFMMARCYERSADVAFSFLKTCSCRKMYLKKTFSFKTASYDVWKWRTYIILTTSQLI